MTEIRAITVMPPDGDWRAVALKEAESPEGPWTTVQAAQVQGPGQMTIAFRPRVANGFYKTLWVAEGGSRNGLGEGPVVQLVGTHPVKRGKAARIGGNS